MVLYDDLHFYNLIREAVHKQWDPIGIRSELEEMGEYDGYIPALFKLLKSDSSEEQVFNYLWVVETGSMGLNGNEEATREFTKWLISLKTIEKSASTKLSG